ncbi:MAG: DUF420 domain-containing protein [Elusimicrobia bacterium]|nr:DUF420 domain-containing protein [Elusimicrobiota bacterium]
MPAWPSFNAGLNFLGACLLTLGYFMIRRRQVKLHRLCMSLAFAVSIVFLISYLLYHYQAGSVKFQGIGALRTIYLGILISHTALAALVPPLALRTMYLALKKRYAEHRRAARWTLPVWLYVCVTGVIVYLMLYFLPLFHA